MVTSGLPGLFSSSKSGKANFIFPIFFAIVISLFLVQVILLVSPYEDATVVSLQRSFSSLTVVNLLVVSVFAGVVLFSLFRFKRIRTQTASKLLVAMFIEGGMLAILLFGKLLFISLGLESPIFLVFVAIVAYIGSYFVFLSFANSLSRKAKNRLFIVSSASANFGLVASGFSLLLILVGALVTMKLTSKQRHVPGLPIATALGLLPSIFLLVF